MPTTPKPGGIAALALMEGGRADSVPAMGRRDAAVLAAIPLFAGLSRRHLRHVAELAERVTYAPGRIIVHGGSKGTGFYVILDGEAKVVKGYSSRSIARLGPGDFFGEMSLLDGEPRTASVISETPVTAMRLTRAAFRSMLKREPDVALKVMEELSRRIRRLERSPTQ